MDTVPGRNTTGTQPDDIEAAGPIAGTDQNGNNITVDWQITVDASPGDYAYLCWFHPGMQGQLHVVGADDPATSQAENDAQTNAQFQVDRVFATLAEATYKHSRYSGGAPGTRTYDVAVGATTADDHADVLEMMPQHLDLVDGDKVAYSWKQTTNEAHSVSFPAESSASPEPAGFDCGGNLPVARARRTLYRSVGTCA